VITQTSANHRQVEGLLADLRAAFARPHVATVATTAPVARPLEADPSRGDRRFYDVRDMVLAIEAGYGDRLRPASKVSEAKRELIDAVTENVEPLTWHVSPVAGGTIAIIGGRMVVTQTPEVHDLLGRFLVELRAELVEGAAAPATGPATSPSAPTPAALPPAGG
jgi:hypothetical protein